MPRQDRRRKNTWFARYLAGLFLLTTFAQADVPKWPDVANGNWEFDFPNAGNAAVKIPILGVEDEALYLLECHTGGYEGDVSFYYSGDFHCRLTSLYIREVYTNSLSTRLYGFPSLGRSNRGRVFVEELWEKCGEYPEFGRIRNFRLRGMVLTLEFSNIVFTVAAGEAGPARKQPIRLQSYSLAVQVVPDKSAISAIAEPVPYADPNLKRRRDPTSMTICEEIIPQHVPGIITHDYVKSKGLESPYPQITPLQRTFTISGNPLPQTFRFPNHPLPSEAKVVELPIHDVNGKIVYQFECSAYNVPDGEGRIDRYGIACGLFAAGKSHNLLEDSVDPVSQTNRAQVLPDQLYGKCGDYPEWGLRRQFRLRGFRLTMLFNNPVFTEGEFFGYAIKKVDLLVKVELDPAATDPVALPSKYVSWPLFNQGAKCEKVFTNPYPQVGTP